MNNDLDKEKFILDNNWFKEYGRYHNFTYARSRDGYSLEEAYLLCNRYLQTIRIDEKRRRVEELQILRGYDL